MTGPRPLAGRRVVVTRARHQAEALGGELERRGALVLYMPVIAIADPGSWEDLDRALEDLAGGGCDWVAFTSANAVHTSLSRLELLDLGAGALGHVKVAAVGASTAAALAEAGVSVDLVPDRFTGAALAQALGRGPGRIVLPRVEGAPRGLVEALTEGGWSVLDVPAYRNLPAEPGLAAAEVVAGRFEAATFASASAVRGWPRLAGPPAQLGLAPGQRPRRVTAFIGPPAAAAAAEAGLRVDAVAREHTAEGLAKALEARLGSLTGPVR